MAESIISLINVSYTYPSGVVALDRLNIEIPKGKRIALIGGNGAGKSTMLFMLNGILKPTEGFVACGGTPYQYNRKAIRDIRTRVGFLFQDSDNQLLAPSVYEEISFGLNNLRMHGNTKMTKNMKNQVREKVQSVMEDFHLSGLSNRPPHELSAGQKKRVCLAGILAMEPELLVCDEPTSNLDAKHARLTIEYIDKLNNEGKTVLIATHDVDLAYQWADHIIVIKEGKELCSGESREIFSDKELIESADLKLPFLVQAVDELSPGLEVNELPRSLEELRKCIGKV